MASFRTTDNDGDEIRMYCTSDSEAGILIEARGIDDGDYVATVIHWDKLPELLEFVKAAIAINKEGMEY